MSSLHAAFDELVADVPTYGDLDRAIQRAARERRRNGVVAGLVASAAVVAVILGALAITDSDDDAAPTPIDTPTPTEATTEVGKRPDRIRPGTGTLLTTNGSSDPRDVAIDGMDIRSISAGESGGHREIQVEAEPPRTVTLDPAEQVYEYGVVVDADGDRVPDCQIGANNDARPRGAYRVSVSNLRTNDIDELGSWDKAYSPQLDFTHAGDPEIPGSSSVTFFLWDRPRPCEEFGASAAFYVWSSFSQGGRVSAWDYATDTAWLRQPNQ